MHSNRVVVYFTINLVGNSQNGIGNNRVVVYFTINLVRNSQNGISNFNDVDDACHIFDSTWRAESHITTCILNVVARNR